MIFREDEKEKGDERAGEQCHPKTGTFFIHSFFSTHSKDDRRLPISSNHSIFPKNSNACPIKYWGNTAHIVDHVMADSEV